MADGGSSLTNALDRMAAAAVDSDGDAASDIDELVAGSDPNSAASTPAAPGSVDDPRLACGIAGAGGPAGAQAWATLILLAWGLGRRRRRAGRR